MKGLVSKVRARTTKTREKQASKASSEKLPLTQSPFTGMAIAMILWVLSVVIIATEETFTSPGENASFLPLAGMSILLLAALLGTSLGLQIVKPGILKQNSRILLISIISILSLASVRAILFVNSQFAFLSDDLIIFIIPLCITPLLTTILLGSKTGIVTGCWNSIAISFLMGGDFRVLLIGVIATTVSAQTARNVKTRTKIIKTGLLLGLCKFILVFSETAVNWQTSEVSTVLHQTITCIAGGLLSAVVVLILLPLFESLFRITTNITLFELTDLGHPLLQRLAIEAPGTYHHSLVVANLAQAAADEIEANSLLTRICSYFHDVGKLTKPDFFAENIQLEENPHDNLPPSMSTLVITAHVKEGLSLAILNKLPPPILDVIREHHGTSLLSYFHHKAKSQLEFELGQAEDASKNGQTKLDEGDFRYPGPKPTTRESGIICLADPVEAASRSMKKKTPGHIESMINDIVLTRLSDGQLDDCCLTLSELTKIKRSFVFTLTNMMHGRVPYPEDENRDKQQSKPAPSEQQKNKSPDKQNNGQGPEN